MRKAGGSGGGGVVRDGGQQEVGLIYLLPLVSAADKILTFALRQPARCAGYWVKELALYFNENARHIMLACVKERARENL